MLPLINENKWESYLNQCPGWSPPLCSTIILSPHPDDETLGAGGLIAELRKKGIDVLIIAITDGENAYNDIENLALIRQKEQEKALNILGVSKEKIIRLGLKDSDVASAENRLNDLILPYITPGVHLLAPWTGDFHPDHEAVGRVGIKIAKQKEILLSFYFFWTWHQETISMISSLPLKIYPITPNTLDKKQLALKCYQSQQYHPSQQPILPEHLLGPAKRLFEVYYPYEKKY